MRGRMGRRRRPVALLAGVALVALAAAGFATDRAAGRVEGVAAQPMPNSVAAIRALDQPFTIAALPDTQVYAEENQPAFKEQVDWVLANAKAKNIVFVTHLGDVVDNGTDEVQWANAMAALDPLLKQEWLPFSIVRGNHDDPAQFLIRLGPEVMAQRPWYVGASPSQLCQAQTFKVQEVWFLHIGFQKDPTAEDLAWACRLVKKPWLKHMPIIVSTHDYIDGSGKSSTGRMIWDGFVKNNPGVFMVLNGHTHTEYALVSHDAANRPVYQMLSDYQDRAFGGNGLMRLITVDPVKDTVSVKTFSPFYRVEKPASITPNYHETDADSQFEYSVNVHERLLWNTTFDFGPEPPPPPPPPLNDMPAGAHYSHIFQNRRPLVGTSTPYAGTVDLQINENNAGLDYGGEATLTTDMDDNGSRVHAMLRFDGLVGTGPGQIAANSTITSARLVFSATSSTKGMVIMHRMLLPWSEQSTWMDFTPQPVSWKTLTYLNTDTGIYRYQTQPRVMVGGGIDADNTEAMTEEDATFTMPKPVQMPFILQAGGMSTPYAGYSAIYQAPAWDPNDGLPIPKPAPKTLTIDLTKAVQAWVNGQRNYGWFFEPTSSDGWDFETAEGKQPPALLVEVDGAPLVQ
jgi:predicted phosphodiesterase